jgi:hypothetical protein
MEFRKNHVMAPNLRIHANCKQSVVDWNGYGDEHKPNTQTKMNTKMRVAAIFRKEKKAPAKWGKELGLYLVWMASSVALLSLNWHISYYDLILVLLATVRSWQNWKAISHISPLISLLLEVQSSVKLQRSRWWNTRNERANSYKVLWGTILVIPFSRKCIVSLNQGPVCKFCLCLRFRVRLPDWRARKPC